MPVFSHPLQAFSQTYKPLVIMGHTDRITISKTIQPEPYCPFKVEATRHLNPGDIIEFETAQLSHIVNTQLAEECKNYHLAKRVKQLEADKSYYQRLVSELRDSRDEISQEIDDLRQDRQRYFDIQLLEAQIINLHNLRNELSQEVQDLENQRKALINEQIPSALDAGLGSETELLHFECADDYEGFDDYEGYQDDEEEDDEEEEKDGF